MQEINRDRGRMIGFITMIIVRMKGRYRLAVLVTHCNSIILALLEREEQYAALEEIDEVFSPLRYHTLRREMIM